MADEAIAEFIGFTGCTQAKAVQYLKISDNNLEQAVQLYFDSPDIGDSPVHPSSNNHTSSAPRTSSRTARASRYGSGGNIIDLDSDGDAERSDDDDELVEIGATARGNGSASHRPGGGRAARTILSNTPPPRGGGGGSGGDFTTDEAFERDAAIARSMQEALYADGAMPDEDGVRAPMARTTETLVGPGADFGAEPEEIEQMMAQIHARQHRGYSGRVGIFNQQASLWDEQNPNPNSLRQNLARATGGASEASTKASMLAELFRPPFELMSHLSWEEARQKGKDQEKWLLVNIQDQAVFDCQVLNRDIWKHAQIKETVKENFIFLQYNKDDPRVSQYVQYYFAERNNQDAYPHIAIVDPRTGEHLKVWSGPPVPKATDFLEQLHDFLGRYSLDVNAKNPVARRKPDKKKTLDVARMTEDEMLEMALKNSMGSDVTLPPEDDPDALTKSVGEMNNDKRNKLSKSEGKMAETQQGEDAMEIDSSDSNSLLPAPSSAPSLFSGISSTNPHVEPAPSQPDTTRIQFRHSGGRIIRRFALTDPVSRIFEWLKAEPLEGKSGMEFELVCMGTNLVDHLDESIEAAGLKNQTVMVEFTEN
ncbi:MAG: hypothetical protein M1829_005428 [Trizodia sp. TS-e1964]|nr:MAG: hypothetical protein M1829_005428 [Trizodia sp. TS-e1964]